MTERIPRRGIYLLPNLFTTAALFFGFYAMISAIGGHYESAAIGIFIAMIMDSLDGRIARLTHTQTDFGAEYDSLADMVSFGLAPALLMYLWSLSALGRPGWLGAFIYTACAALRLARFNTQIGKTDRAYFQGLPSPAAAAMLAALVWVCHDYGIDGKDWSLLVLLLTIVLGILMFSRVRYHSFKDLELKRRVPFLYVPAVVFAFVLISVDPAQILFALVLLYVISGPTLTLLELRRRRASRRPREETLTKPADPENLP